MERGAVNNNLAQPSEYEQVSTVTISLPTGQQAGAEIPARWKNQYDFLLGRASDNGGEWEDDDLQLKLAIEDIARAEAELRLSRESRLGHDVELQFLRTEIVSLRSQLAAAQLKAEEE